MPANNRFLHLSVLTLTLSCGPSASEKAAPQAVPRPRLEFLGDTAGGQFPGPSGMKCGPVGEKRTRVCSLLTQPKIGEVRVINTTKRYLDDKLYSWGFGFEPADYDLLVAALTERYGVPDSTSELIGPLLGVEMKSEGKFWIFADGRLAIQQITSRDGEGGGTVSAESTAGLAELERREAAELAQKSAEREKRRAAATEAAARDLSPPVKK